MSMCANCYLNRPGESLVLEGYRLFNCGLLSNDASLWAEIPKLYSTRLGSSKGVFLFNMFFDFMRELECSVSCSLKFESIGCSYLCRHEVMILGLVSGLQHGESTTATLCLDAIAADKKQSRLMVSAEAFAVSLRALGGVLLPVPADTMRQILSEGISSATIQ